MDPILGYFIFQNMGDGCIASKYCHRHLHSSHPETMKRLLATPDEREENLQNHQTERNEFIRRFRTTWIENLDAENSEISTVVITAKVSFPGIFRLQWNDFENEPVFFGEGMIHKGILIGSYWDEDINNQFSL
ncbi:MAG: hypothetical protein M0Q26_11080 [Chitinophagaceae bacterium]|nr:hypothetical protein [Chitinophagaceae bacterium]